MSTTWKRCPECGQAMQLQPRSRLYVCELCRRVWFILDCTEQLRLAVEQVTAYEQLPPRHLVDRIIDVVQSPPRRPCKHEYAFPIGAGVWGCPTCGAQLARETGGAP